MCIIMPVFTNQRVILRIRYIGDSIVGNSDEMIGGIVAESITEEIVCIAPKINGSTYITRISKTGD